MLTMPKVAFATAFVVAAGIATAAPTVGAVADAEDRTIAHLAGNGQVGVPVPGPALQSPFQRIEDVAGDAQGNVYVADNLYVGDRYNNAIGQILKVAPDGTLSSIAGTGEYSWPIEGPAAQSPLLEVTELDVASDGSVILAGRRFVSRISPDGMLTHLAGNGELEPAEGVVARDTAVSYFTGVAVSPTGTVHLSTPNDVWAIDDDGTLRRVLGVGYADYGPADDGAHALETGTSPSALDFLSDGDLVVSDLGVVVAVDAETGIVRHLAGTGAYGAAVPGPATETPLDGSTDVVVDPLDNLYIAQPTQILKVDTAGQLSVHVGNGTESGPEEGAGLEAQVRPSGMAWIDGDLHYGTSTERVSRVFEAEAPAAELAATTTTATVSPGHVRSGGSVRVAVRVRSEDSAPTGTVRVEHEGVVLAEGAVDRRGRTRLRPVLALSPGTQTLTVRYVGSDVHAESVAAVEVRVKPAKRR